MAPTVAIWVQFRAPLIHLSIFTPVWSGLLFCQVTLIWLEYTAVATRLLGAGGALVVAEAWLEYAELFEAL